MATLNPTNAIATQAVHHAAAQLAALDWIDQEEARQLSPMAEAVANMFMVLYYQAETGRAVIFRRRLHQLIGCSGCCAASS